MGTKEVCAKPEEHHLHFCQLKATPMNPEIEKMFDNPAWVCTSCGARVNRPENVCSPKEL